MKMKSVNPSKDTATDTITDFENVERVVSCVYHEQHTHGHFEVFYFGNFEFVGACV